MKNEIIMSIEQGNCWVKGWQRMTRKAHHIIEAQVVYKRSRWVVLWICWSVVLYRIMMYEYLVLVFFLGLDIIYLVVQYFTPSGLPDPDGETEGSLIYVEEAGDILHGGEGGRPVLRSITEFELWKHLIVTMGGCWIATLWDLSVFPVYWPFLLIYLFWLVGLAIYRHCRHMHKYGYSLHCFVHRKLPLSHISHF